jgi:serine/threonine protein kinase
VNAVIADFGILKVMTGTANTLMVGTAGFKAPEVIVERSVTPPYTTKSDVFSFGMILWCLHSKTIDIFTKMTFAHIDV